MKDKKFDEIVNFNLHEVEPSIAGPTRPQDKIFLNIFYTFKEI